MIRDFTYIDDIVEGLYNVILNPAQINPVWDPKIHISSSSSAPYKIYNIGNNTPTELLDFISSIEEFLGLTADKELLPLQDGDVPDTFADVTNLRDEFNFSPSTPLNDGISKFLTWYREYYEV